MTRYFDDYISSLYDKRYYMLPYFFACPIRLPNTTEVDI